MEFTCVSKCRRCANSSNRPLKQNVLTTRSRLKILKDNTCLSVVASGKKDDLCGAWATAFASPRANHQPSGFWGTPTPLPSQLCPCFIQNVLKEDFIAQELGQVKFLSQTTLPSRKMASAEEGHIEDCFF